MRKRLKFDNLSLALFLSNQETRFSKSYGNNHTFQNSLLDRLNLTKIWFLLQVNNKSATSGHRQDVGPVYYGYLSNYWTLS